METNSDSKLISIIKRKGIDFARGDKNYFKNYDYYQVVNGYKNLFIVDVESIEDIHNNIVNGIDLNRYLISFKLDSSLTNPNQIFKKICQKICLKYGLYYDSKLSNGRLIMEIKKINYVHHIYAPTAKYSDFIRMYKFEHELRLLLLRYTLIIEENMKNIFIKYLNNHKAQANYLTDINNYNLEKDNTMALETLKKIIDEHGNKHSKPIKRKRDQNITIPYWILINELSMNQTYKAIDNLEISVSRSIFQDCLNHFTNLNLNYRDRTKSHQRRNVEKGKINNFKILLSYLAEFRNMLAHNQPIYSFNIANTSLSDYPTLRYSKPKIQSNQNINDQHLMNASLMYEFQDFFGVDAYNSQNYQVNINLGTIIYMIYKMISHIDHNTEFYSELLSVYSKYNILFSTHENYIEDYNKIVDLKNKISEFPNLNIDEIIEKTKSGEKHLMDIKKLNRAIDNYRKELTKLSNEIVVKKKISKYTLFPANAQYTHYTGIDVSYFNKIK